MFVVRRVIRRLQRRKFAKGDRLDRRANAVVADLLYGHAARLGDDFGNRQAAEPALAGSHAGTAEGLGLIGSQAAELYVAADRARGDLFAAADDRVVGWAQERRCRHVERVEEGTNGQVIVQGPAFRLGAGLADLGGDRAEFAGCMKTRKGTLVLRGHRAADPAAVAGDR